MPPLLQISTLEIAVYYNLRTGPNIPKNRNGFLEYKSRLYSLSTVRPRDVSKCVFFSCGKDDEERFFVGTDIENANSLMHVQSLQEWDAESKIILIY